MSVTMGDAILYLSANPDALNAGLKKADSKIKTFANGAKNILGSALKAGMIGAGIAIAAGLGILTKSVMEAADAGEAMAKFDATFGGASEGLVKSLDELAGATGRSRYELRASAADFGAVTKALGFSEEGAADMSAAALTMAVDLGAFHNLPTEDVANRIQKALTGETESMKALGIVINQNRIKQELLNMGITDNVNEVSEAVKAQAIFNIIQGQTGDAVGIAEEEAGSFTGQVVALKAAWSDFMIDVGTQLLPVLTPLLTNFGTFAREILPLVVTWVSTKLVPAFIAFANFINTSVLPAIGSIGGWITTVLVPALQTMWTWFNDNIMPVLLAVADVIGAVLFKAFEILGGLWTNVILPALQAMGEFIDNLLEPIGGVVGAIEKFVDWLGKAADAIRNLKLPDWLIGHSPSPFENTLMGAAKALEKQLNPQIGKFSAQLQASMGNGMGGSTTTTYDQRSYFQGASVDVPNENMLDLLAKQVRRI